MSMQRWRISKIILIFSLSDMSMHFSQLKHMKNLVQTAADGGRWANNKGGQNIIKKMGLES